MALKQKRSLTDRQAARMQRILEVTQKLLGEVGVERMTMRELAAASGVSAATLYNRFGTKDGVVTRAVLDHYEHAVLGKVARGGKTGTPVVQIIGMAEVIVSDCRRRRAFAAALMGAYFKIGNAREMPTRLYEALRQTWLQPLQQMYNSGFIQDWVSVDGLAEELSDRMFSVVMKWSQGLIPARDFREHALMTLLLPLAAGSRGAQLTELLPMLADLSVRIESGRTRPVRQSSRRPRK